jgi:hypothetical protein
VEALCLLAAFALGLIVLALLVFFTDDPDAVVTRLEVVDEAGRCYTRYGCSVSTSRQDQGRTLKVFVAPRSQQS